MSDDDREYKHPVCAWGPCGGRYGTWAFLFVVAVVFIAAVLLVAVDLAGG